MGKVKSAILTTVITLIIAVLCVVCFVPFPTDSIGLNYFNSILGITDKDGDLGGYLVGDTEYVGGGYEVIYSPEGVLTAKEYEDNLAAKTGDEQEEYANDYVAYANGALYLEKESVCDGGTQPTEKFIASFDRFCKLIQERYERLHVEGASVQVCDSYTVRAFLPDSYAEAAMAQYYFSLTGGFTVKYGTSQDAANQIMPVRHQQQYDITHYFKSAGVRSGNGNSYIELRFTKEGQEIIKSATANATSGASGDSDSSSNYLYFSIGDATVVSMTVTSAIDTDVLYVSGGNYNAERAEIVATAIDTAAKYGTKNDVAMTLGNVYRVKAGFGELALPLIYAALGICMLAMAVFFCIRYRGLGVVQIYTFLVYLLAMTLTVWSMGVLHLSIGTVVAVALGGLLLSVCNALVYEYAKKEYATGKTMTTSVQTAYKKTFWIVFDLHVVLLALSLVAFLIALTELATVMLTLTIATFFSAICTLGLNRFLWYAMMPLAKDKAKFCHFSREEVEDDD